jgi:hypothetical protein
MGWIRCISRSIPERQRHFDTETAKRLGMVPSGEGNVQGAGEGTVKVQHLENVASNYRV